MDFTDDGLERADGASAFIIESWMKPSSSRIKSLWAWTDPEEVPLQIALCGAGGTGKTEVGTRLAQRLDLPFIDGIARTLRELDYNINKKANWYTEFLILLGMLWEQNEYDEYITASSVVDLCAYMHYVADRSADDHPHLLRAIGNIGNSISNQEYSVIFYLPLKKKPRPDGVRSVDMKFQGEIDELVRHYLDAFDLDYLPLDGTHSEKAKVALDYLEEFGLLFGRD